MSSPAPTKHRSSLAELTNVRIREFLREPEAVFWTFMFPVLLAIGLGIAFRNKPAEIVNIGVVEGPATDSVLAALGRSKALTAIRVPTMDSGLAAMRNGKIALVVQARSATSVEYRFDDTRPDARNARFLADDAIQRGAGRTDPTTTSDSLVREPGSRYIDFVIPGLMGMNIMGGSIWSLGFAIVDARRKKLLKRLVSTPMSRAEYLLSFLASRLGVLVAEVVLVLGFAMIAFGVPMRGSILQLAVIVLMAAFGFGGLGLLVASRVTTIEGVSGLANASMVPMWVMSGVFFSSENFPRAFQPFIKALPLTATNDALRATMLRGEGWASVAPEVGILAVWALVCGWLALKLFPLAMSGDLSREELLASGDRALKWIARYLAEPERVRVLPDVQPGDVRQLLPASPPENAEPMSEILDDFESVIVPALTHWNHPGFFGYFATSASVPGIVGELLSAAVDVKAMLWKTSPAATELEEVVTDWLRQMIGLDPNWFGMMTDTASMSTMLALAAAREARPELKIRELGMAGRPDLPRMKVYVSELAHSSVEKAALALGLGSANIVKIGCDSEFRMRPFLLRDAVERDIASGALPLACVATVGTTSVASVDPVPEIAAICGDHHIWLHVDAAYAGVAAILHEKRAILAGVEHADSLVVNPHKWLFTPFDCSVLYVRRPEILSRAFSLVPEYLTTLQDEEVVNYMDYGVQLGRKFRALKLWMVIRAFGVEGLAARIREHCQMAGDLGRVIASTPGWHVIAPIHFGLVCFRYCPSGMSDADGDEFTEKIMHAVNATGEVFLSHTKVAGRYAIRLSVGNIRTETSHVRRAWTLILEAARKSASR